MNPPNKRQIAVALAYHGHEPAPRVVAQGRGIIAQAIIKRAKEHGVFVHESEDLVGLLMQVELDQQSHEILRFMNKHAVFFGAFDDRLRD